MDLGEGGRRSAADVGGTDEIPERQRAREVAAWSAVM